MSDDPPRAGRPAPPPENVVEDEFEAPPDSEMCDDLCAPWLLSHSDVNQALPYAIRAPNCRPLGII